MASSSSLLLESEELLESDELDDSDSDFGLASATPTKRDNGKRSAKTVATENFILGLGSQKKERIMLLDYSKL